MGQGLETQLSGAARSTRAVKALACLSLTGVCLLTGCFTPRGADQVRRDTLADVQRQDFATAEVRLNGLYDCNLEGEADKVGGKPEEAEFHDKHGLLWLMQRGLLDHLEADLTGSQQHFHEAADLVKVHRSEVLWREAASLATNETVQPYDGMGFEHIQVDLYRTINALLMAQESEGSYRLDRLAWAPAPAEGELVPPPGRAPVSVDARAYFDRAISIARGMILEQLAFTYDTRNEGWITAYRFADDPFARLMLVATILASPDRTGDRLQLAKIMMEKARQGYSQAEATFGRDKHFRWEVQLPQGLIDRLRARVEQLYDPTGFEGQLRNLGQRERQRIESQLLPAGHGSVLVLNQVGLITRPQVLDVRFRTGVAVLAGLFSLSDKERERGITVRQVTIGPLQVAAKGPGSEIIDEWVGMVFAPALMHQMKYLTMVVGFAMPVHRSDAPIPEPASVLVDGRAHPMAVVSDLDAYARATLKDAQPGLFIKTLTRVAAKQAAVAIAANEVEKKHGEGWGWLSRWVGSQGMTWSEVADVRSWFLLPDHIEATLIDLPVGEHRLRLQSPVGDLDLGTVNVPEGRLVVVPVRTLPPKRYY